MTEKEKIIGLRKSGRAPESFMEDPFGYFEREGINIKPGKKKFDRKEKLIDDPDAVKMFPWTNDLKVVGKMIDTDKGMIKETGDPFYEMMIIDAVRAAGLPATEVIGTVEQDGKYMMITEWIRGSMNWYDMKSLEKMGYSPRDMKRMFNEARKIMDQMSFRFRKAGFIRGWKLNDMIFIIKNKAVIDIVPTDWERTKIKGRQDIIGHRKDCDERYHRPRCY
jgi:hypothetical protein